MCVVLVLLVTVCREERCRCCVSVFRFLVLAMHPQLISVRVVKNSKLYKLQLSAMITPMLDTSVVQC